MSKAETIPVHKDTGIPLSQFYTGATAQWQSYNNAILTLPQLKEYPGVPEHLKIIVMIPEAMENERGNFRDCRWDFEALHFVDVVNGQTYGEDEVVGWTVGAFPA